MNPQTLPIFSFAQILDQLSACANLPASVAAARDELVAAARNDVSQFPVFLRPVTLEELKANPAIRMKYREQPAHHAHLDHAGWERFALSLGDSEFSKALADRLPRVAAAARLTRDPQLVAYVCAQLVEMASWSPLCRPGWSGGSQSDGAWLGTGWATRTITESLALLPVDWVPSDLSRRIGERLRAEITGVRNDWRTRCNWFTQQEAAYSNQWALPTEALILASLHLGLDQHRDDYEFGVANLLRTLDAQGANGEFVEGLEYGFITLESVLSVARAAALIAGDKRIIEHPFLQRFPIWYLHHLQPGGFIINAFDARAPHINRSLIGTLAISTGHPAAVWYLRSIPATTTTTLPVLLAECVLGGVTGGSHGSDDKPKSPPLGAQYPVAARVNWIERWDGIGTAHDNASSFWMRGGHETDAHDHQDRGHVNLIIRGRPVLIEAGLFSYGIPEHLTHFKSVAGHNVPQVGNYSPPELTPQLLSAGAGQILDKAHRSAPLTVNRLDASGGDVTLDGSACYASVRRWMRRAEWTAHGVSIRDEISLHAADTILFRWHLGVPSGTPCSFEPGRVRVGDIMVSYEAGLPLEASVETMPDNTLTPGTLHHHATLVLRTGSPVAHLELNTHISLSTQS